MSLEGSTDVLEQPFTSIPRVTVKFNFGEEKTFTLPFEIGTSTSKLREQLSHILQVPSHELILSHECKCVTDAQTLADFATTRFGTIVMNLFTDHYIDVSRLCNQIYGDIEVKDVITVSVEMGKGKEPKHISVEIIDEKQKKSFIGGYRHQMSGAEYHHATSQTLFQSEIAVKRLERGSQTEPIKISKLEGMPGVVATQTPVAGLHIIEPLNKIIIAKRYVSTNKLDIKRKYRQWLLKARLKSQSHIQERDELLEKQHFQNKSKVLCNTVVSKEKDVKQSEYFSGILKIFSNKFMLMKEIDFLMSHEKMKKEAKYIYQKRVNLGIVKKFCQPYTWTSKNGHTLSMETEYHREFSKWQKMYIDLLNEDLTVIERKQLILSIKEMLEPLEECDSLTLQELLVRQIYLIDAGVKSRQLITLQAITEKYFLFFLKDYAQKCFPKGEDIHYIVNTLWHGKSILSEDCNLNNLRLCRFDKCVQWSPWNCVLITHKEFVAHSFVDNPLEVYGTWLIELVRTKHLMAQLHFKNLYKKSLMLIK